MADNKRSSERNKNKLEAATSHSSTPVNVANEMSALVNKVEGKITSLLRDVEKKFNCLSAEIDSKIKDLFADLEKRMVQTFENRLTSMQSAISDLQQQQRSLETRLDHLERQHKSNVVIISGVPSVSDESLPQIFTNLCQSLKLSTSLKPMSIFRTLTKNKTQSSIIVKFNNTQERNVLLAAVRNTIKTRRISGTNNKTLSIHDVGIGHDTDPHCPIFINENLSLKNYAIKRKALTMVRQKQLAAVFTRSGRVFIRKTNTDAARLISSLSELTELTGNH